MPRKSESVTRSIKPNSSPETGLCSSLPFLPVSASLSHHKCVSHTLLCMYTKAHPNISTLIPLVAALKSLQNAMMLSPACPSAGPTGGAGLACPAPMRRRIDAEIAFLDIGCEQRSAASQERARLRTLSGESGKSEVAFRKKIGSISAFALLLTNQFAGHSKQAPFLLEKTRTPPKTTMATSKISPEGLREAITSE